MSVRRGRRKGKKKEGREDQRVNFLLSGMNNEKGNNFAFYSIGLGSQRGEGKKKKERKRKRG